MTDVQLLGLSLIIISGVLATLHSKKVLVPISKAVIAPDYPGASLSQFVIAVIVAIVSLSLLPKKSGVILSSLILVGGLSVNQSLVDNGTLTGPSLLDSIAQKR